MARATKRETDTKTTGEARFEFARRHVVKEMRLETELHAARKAHYAWEHHDADGTPFRTAYQTRRPRTPEERNELRVLEAAIIDARTKLLLHENDGRDL